jgi:hypothetical protein
LKSTKADAAITLAAMSSKLSRQHHPLGLSSKLETKANVVRIFHGIYSTEEGLDEKSTFTRIT